MISRLFASFMLVLGLLVGSASAQHCDGCRLFLVTWDDAGFYLGNAPIPGVATSMTLGIGSGNGQCNGTYPNCEPVPCAFAKVSIRVDNVAAGGPIDVQNPDGTPRSTLNEEDGGIFTVKSTAAGGSENLSCGSLPKVALRVKLPNGNTYNLGLLCTNCPGQDPY